MFLEKNENSRPINYFSLFFFENGIAEKGLMKQNSSYNSFKLWLISMIIIMVTYTW